MKTKNNVQKAILRSIAVVVSFVLISFTVSAQGFWKKLLENSSFNEIALAMVETSDGKADSESFSMHYYMGLLENEAEPALKVEDWMKNESFSGSLSFELSLESEDVLEVEDWMLSDEVFQVSEIGELPLEIESWMTDKNGWEI